MKLTQIFDEVKKFESLIDFTFLPDPGGGIEIAVVAALDEEIEDETATGATTTTTPVTLRRDLVSLF